MILFPAIDLKEGPCVRLKQGDMARATVFQRRSGRAGAALSTQQGFECLHVVDLDGAFAGKPVNAAAVERILESIGIPVQLGGGIRDMATVEGWLGKGVDRVIIGTAAVRNPALVKRRQEISGPRRGRHRCARRQGRGRRLGGNVRARPRSISRGASRTPASPRSSTPTSPRRHAARAQLDATIALADAVSIPVIASGGLASLDDIKRLLEPRARKLAGAIAGRALYDGRLDAAEALQADPRCAGGGLMFKVRVIPCLDVKDGRVVKGVNFVDLRDAGDPVEAAIAYDAAGADELCFLDITASHENRDTISRRRARAPPKPASCR